ncbi:MAG: hypothetical protein CVV49_01305 [Spirochaetae bacterium HGW-Spirochaetae-5]|nr:MAG: hypothetical protein CVV49_01305 [Spirochaetae bacterium HGW-Spirochaetae-5]
MVMYFKKNIYRLLIIIVLSAAAAVGLSTGARIIADKKNGGTPEERLKYAIRLYETAETLNINLEGVPFFGKKTAAAHLIIFFDYTCSHCKKEFELVQKLEKKYPDEISVSYKFFPIDGTCKSFERGRDDPSAGACIAAKAAYSSYSQNRFMEFSGLLFDWYHTKSNQFTVKTVSELAKNFKLNFKSFNTIFLSEKTESFISREYNEAEKLGIESTPTVFLNGRLIPAGSRKADILEGLVKYCIKRGK